MWVVKLGGSLAEGERLPEWLALLATVGRGRVVVVPGGGRFADEVRTAQRHWQFDDVAAHNMAVLAMAQTAMMMRSLVGTLEPVLTTADVRRVLRRAGTALWMPMQALRDQPDELTSWDVTSDSLALWLARQLNAERLTLVKSCAVEPRWDVAEWAARGIVDAAFEPMARHAGLAIDVLSSDQVETLRSWLTGTPIGTSMA